MARPVLDVVSRYCTLGALVITLVAFSSLSAAQEGTPGANQGREPLINAEVRGLPSDPAIVALVRFTFAPGAVFPNIGVPGPTVIRIIEGELYFRFPGEADEIEENGVQITTVSSNATPLPATPIADPNVRVVRSGEQISIPADVPHDIRNDSNEQAIFYAVALTTFPPTPEGPIWPPAGMGPETLPAGVTAESLDVGYEVVATLPPAPVQMTLDRLTLPPDANLPGRTGNELALYVVENGELSLTGDDEIPIRRGTGGPGVSSTPETDLLLAAGDSALVQPGTGVSGRNAADGPLDLLQLTIAPAIPPAGTPEPGTATPT